ncbi:ras guanine nucleotide exchange factor glfB isoform X2 [Drosophila biarmipes]|uniref:ras guanine nucleotide exchange factor glfB isoform X2 n=1 Tax=Drosophila biarmipes TaxID=125945 RepID=UPI0007E7F8B7|nr:ras guanine nucleotide exchange factor glfB isoform X2 [Drosophila biarmipes]
MSNQLERLLFFIVVISGALCTVEDYVIMSQCAHNKAIHLAAEGTVSVTDTSQIQNITIVGFPDYLNNEFKIALYAKETQRYLCFNDNWRLVGMRELRDTCYFNETIVHGYFVFRSVVDLQRRVGFTHRGKPVGPKKSVNDACYMFNKIEAEQFFRHHHSNGNGNGNSGSNSNSGNSNITRKPPRNNKNNRHKSNNQNQKLQQQQEHHGHNNNNVILNNSSTSLSSTNKKQLAINRQKQQQQQQQQQHQVRHHHNDPSLLLRRQQHEKKQKRRKQQKQQQHQQRVSASPTKQMPAPATATPTPTPIAAATIATQLTTTTLSSKRKGRRRKGKGRPKAQQQQQLQLLATAATLPYTDDTLYSSSSSSTGFEDLDTYNSSSNSGSSSSLEPWSTWSTIDSFSSSSTTATSEDSISSSSSSSSNYDAWATYITEMEAEASGGNDTELLHYEPELVDDPEAESTATIETKATSAIAATAATTTSTSGSQLVIEQTPLARSNRSSSSTTTRATPMVTSQTEIPAQSTQQPGRHRSNSKENPRDNVDNSKTLLAAENEVKPQQHPRKLLWTVQPPVATHGSTRATLMTTPMQQLSSTAATAATTLQQHAAPSLFSVDKNINSNLNNTLTEASPTATSEAAATSSITAATTMKRPIRKFTKKLMATPYHQLTYVRNAGGDIDIDNLDNISVYPVLYNGDLEGNGSGNSSDTGFSGFLPTSTTSHLTEPIRIGMNRIRPNKTLHWFTHQRFA